VPKTPPLQARGVDGSEFRWIKQTLAPREPCSYRR
jgi:hypothetical protein